MFLHADEYKETGPLSVAKIIQLKEGGFTSEEIIELQKNKLL